MPRTLSVASAIFACLVATPLVHADTFTFQTLDNPAIQPSINRRELTTRELLLVTSVTA
jgi:hypothetical protein